MRIFLSNCFNWGRRKNTANEQTVKGIACTHLLIYINMNRMQHIASVISDDSIDGYTVERQSFTWKDGWIEYIID